MEGGCECATVKDREQPTMGGYPSLKLSGANTPLPALECYNITQKTQELEGLFGTKVATNTLHKNIT
jgi:hypothetical protein